MHPECRVENLPKVNKNVFDPKKKNIPNNFLLKLEKRLNYLFKNKLPSEDEHKSKVMSLDPLSR